MKAKEYPKTRFVTKDNGTQKYFLGVEIAHRKHGLILSQRNALSLLQETGLLGCKLMHTPMATNAHLQDEIGLLFEDVFLYKRLVSKFIYFTVIRPNIAYIIELVNQIMYKPRKIHWNAALRI